MLRPQILPMIYVLCCLISTLHIISCIWWPLVVYRYHKYRSTPAGMLHLVAVGGVSLPINVLMKFGAMLHLVAFVGGVSLPNIYRIAA